MNNLDKSSIIGISALLVHAAKIDEIYSDHEKDLIKNFIKSYLKDEDVNEILKEAEEIENNSNQLLNFTNIIKQNSMDTKKDVITHLWKVIISDNLLTILHGIICLSCVDNCEVEYRILSSAWLITIVDIPQNENCLYNSNNFDVLPENIGPEYSSKYPTLSEKLSIISILLFILYYII